MSHQKQLKTGYMPEDVVEKIISFLPIKKLYSLSILSKRFKNSWRICRDLSFDKDFAKNLTRDEYRNIVDDFFNDDSNTCADRFKLYYDASDENSLISFWVGKAIRLGIKELELDLIHSDDTVTLDYDLVDVETLHTLKLVNCELHLPLSSNGLRHLREITLQKVMAPPMLTESMFTNCVSLRSMHLVRCSLIYSLKAFAQDLKFFDTLVVKDCADVHLIVINAPSLRTFHYHGKMMELVFDGDNKFLTDVVLEITHSRAFQCLSHRNELVDRLASVETLTVSSAFLEGLCDRYGDNGYTKMQFFLRKLKEFHLVVAPESFINPSDVAVFIKKCPRLERLFIDVGRDAFGSSSMWDHYGKNYLNSWEATLPLLKYVRIKGFAMREVPIYMARFILKHATNLQRLVLVKARIHNFPLNYTSENLRWGIISTARIEMYSYRAEKDTILPNHL